MTTTAHEREANAGDREGSNERQLVIEGFESIVEAADSLAWWGLAALAARAIFPRSTR